MWEHVWGGGQSGSYQQTGACSPGVLFLCLLLLLRNMEAISICIVHKGFVSMVVKDNNIYSHEMAYAFSCDTCI